MTARLWKSKWTEILSALFCPPSANDLRKKEEKIPPWLPKCTVYLTETVPHKDLVKITNINRLLSPTHFCQEHNLKV